MIFETRDQIDFPFCFALNVLTEYPGIFPFPSNEFMDHDDDEMRR